VATTSPSPHPATPRRIAVFGLGYVGSVCASCLASLGHEVIGVDAVPGKVDALNAGVSPVLEPGLTEGIRRGLTAHRLRATVDAAEAVAASDLALICVGTPSLPNGGQDLGFVERVAGEIGGALRARASYYGVVVRSTVVPGTTEELVAPALSAAAGRASGEGFGVASNPEFLREGSAITDFLAPPYTVVGTTDAVLANLLRDVYVGVDAAFVITAPRTAEMLKFASNAFHGVKIAFANEIAVLAQRLGVDGREVMRLVAEDRKLNISEKYLRPGFAFGGSCLPKDLRALTHLARRSDAELPLLDSVLRSNDLHLRRAIELVERTGRRRVGILGLAFKPGTDDLRESPIVEVTQTLLGRGYQVAIYDPSLDVTRLVGANRRFIDEHVPHLAALLGPSAERVVESSDVVIVSYDAPEFRRALAGVNGSTWIVDLAGTGPADAGHYRGIAW